MSDSSELSPIVKRFIEDAGNTTRSFGLGRALGQIFAYLYFSLKPRALADIQRALGVSKGSASTGVRQLEQWGAVRKVWVKGDRKDYYEAGDWFGNIFKNAVMDTFGKKMASYNSLLNEVETDLPELPAGSDGEKQFIADRIKQMRIFQKRAAEIWGSEMVKKLLK